MLCQHPTTGCFEVQILSKNHPGVIAKLVSRQKVELTSNVGDMFMKFTNLGLNLPVVCRTLFLALPYLLCQI